MADIDLIARLRALACAEHDDLRLADEAADEIGHLRDEIEHLIERVRKAEAEIERLRANWRAAEQALMVCEDHCNNHCPGRQP